MEFALSFYSVFHEIFTCRGSAVACSPSSRQPHKSIGKQINLQLLKCDFFFPAFLRVKGSDHARTISLIFKEGNASLLLTGYVLNSTTSKRHPPTTALALFTKPFGTGIRLHYQYLTSAPGGLGLYKTCLQHYSS